MFGLCKNAFRGLIKKNTSFRTQRSVVRNLPNNIDQYHSGDFSSFLVEMTFLFVGMGYF